MSNANRSIVVDDDAPCFVYLPQMSFAVSVLLISGTVSSPRQEKESFFRGAVETIPKHDPLPQPIRASVESVPLRNRRDEGYMRLPLRDAVEKRPIPVIDPQFLAKAIEVCK
ncbi:hypothetical protein RR46_14941 [Papilio xuthus]|uniref:Uncharacterized protein n=1 Tax=Papilio xuthus TaxID=66420 RepID=A0A194PDV3_PAPXU|nr:hypothetical protein RR46_14941 [Papilio xuthus]